MNNEMFSGLVNEVLGSFHAEYLMPNHDAFYDVGFRVMKNQQKSNLLQCHRLKYNGQLKLVYFLNDMTAFDRELLEADERYTYMLVYYLLDAIQDIENNGFLNINCIERRLNKVYVDSHTKNVKLIYVPLNLPVNSQDKVDFEAEIKSGLVQLLKEKQEADSAGIERLITYLTDDTLQLSEVGRQIQAADSTLEELKEVQFEKSEKIGCDEVVIKAVDTTMVFHIHQENYILGKSAERADGVIAGNPTVSRVHCRIFKAGGDYYLIDMGSANGTFFNRERVSSTTPVKLTNGGSLRIANMEFMVWRKENE